MKRVAIIADSHYDLTSRFQECVEVHDWIVDDIATRGVDAIVHTGDVYERKSNPEERQAVSRFAQRAANEAPFIVVRGNHDALGDLLILERLKAKHPIIVRETVDVIDVAGVRFGLLGWPQRGNLHSILLASGHDDAGKDDVEAAAGDALRSVLRYIGLHLDQFTGPTMLVSHAMVDGSRVSTGQPLVGCDFSIGLADLALAQAGFYALGHIHLGQEWDIAGAPCVYPGSPRRTAFGELESKFYVIAEHNGDKWSYERIETPARKMLQFVASYTPELGRLFIPSDQPADEPPSVVVGAEVRYRYEVTREHREAAATEAKQTRDHWLSLGAHSVKLEEQVIVETRARAPEVAAAKTLPDRLVAFWNSKGFDPGERRAPMLEKLNQIEKEARDAT